MQQACYYRAHFGSVTIMPVSCPSFRSSMPIINLSGLVAALTLATRLMQHGHFTLQMPCAGLDNC